MKKQNRKRIEIAAQDNIDDCPAGVAKVLEALGHEEALVTDLSQVFDFITWIPEHLLTEAEKREFKQEETETLACLSALVGREVKGIEYVFALAREVEDSL